MEPVSLNARTFEQRPVERLEKLPLREVARLFRSPLLDAPWALLSSDRVQVEVVNGMTSQRAHRGDRQSWDWDCSARDPPFSSNFVETPKTSPKTWKSSPCVLRIFTSNTHYSTAPRMQTILLSDGPGWRGCFYFSTDHQDTLCWVLSAHQETGGCIFFIDPLCGLQVVKW
jgi:hypothetical protein